MSSSAGSIDVSRLEKELVSALEADRKYSRENDAKFRAVHQKVATYEEFREIVNASHLMPLERKDLRDSSRKQPWNMVAHLRGAGGQESTSTDVTVGLTSDPYTRPADGQEFVRVWRTLKQSSPSHQYRLLMSVGGIGLSELFKVEISMGLLGEILCVLNGDFTESDSSEILSILWQMTECPRFNLSVTFLNKAEKEAVKELCKRLSPYSTQTNELGQLYSVDSVTIEN